MTDYVEPGALPGFPASSRTRRITYEFEDGVQGPDHLEPGASYRGTRRDCYLPVPEGDAVFRRLRVAFERRLIFRIGTSLTTGRSNCVVAVPRWNRTRVAVTRPSARHDEASRW